MRARFEPVFKTGWERVEPLRKLWPGADRRNEGDARRRRVESEVLWRGASQGPGQHNRAAAVGDGLVTNIPEPRGSFNTSFIEAIQMRNRARILLRAGAVDAAFAMIDASLAVEEVEGGQASGLHEPLPDGSWTQ